MSDATKQSEHEAILAILVEILDELRQIEDHRYHDTDHQGCGSIQKGVALDTVVANSLGELEREMTLYGKE